MPKKRLLFSFFYCCQRQNYIKIKMKKIRIRLNTAFRKVGEPKCLPRKAKGGGEGVTLTWWTRKFAVSFFWQNFYFPLVYSYLNRLFFVEILKIKKDLAGALQGVLCLLPYFSLVNCIALAYKIFYPIYAQYIKIFIEYLLRILKRNNNNNDYNQIETIIIMIIRW